jgi:hypothetical protein
MATTDLATLHGLLLGIERGDDLGWVWSERLPAWALRASAALVAEIASETGPIRVFGGPWGGLRLLARRGDGWVEAEVTRPPRAPSGVPRGLAHRLTTPQRGWRR